MNSDTSSRRFSPKDANRVAHFNHFRGYALPYTNITCRVDVTILIDRCKARTEAIFPAMLIAVTRAVNAVEQLRQRIDGDEIVEYSVVHPAYTTLLTDDTIRFCPTQFSDDRSQFIENIAISKQNASNDSPLEPHVGRDDLIFISVLPRPNPKWRLCPTHRLGKVFRCHYSYNACEPTSTPRARRRSAHGTLLRGTSRGTKPRLVRHPHTDNSATFKGGRPSKLGKSSSGANSSIS